MSGDGRMSMQVLADEATRQLNICNACRYCEGYCAVFPALERRNLLAEGDVLQLANLCHDCRACFDACMYAPPHEFALNLPLALAQARLESYRRYVWPSNVPRILRGRLGLFSGAVVAVLVVFAIALATAGPAKLTSSPVGAWSPYDILPFPALLTVILVPTVYAVVVAVVAARRFWLDGDSRPARFRLGAVWCAVGHALTLRNLRGGGDECYYPEDDEPSAARRHLHGFVLGGFGLCFVSTVAAAILEHLLHDAPPYQVVSVPVITGLVGGVGMVIGCTGLLMLKARSSNVTSFAEMTVKDYGLLVALQFLALSGLATFLVRDTRAFGIVFLVHIASVALAFAAAPYSKFVHGVYRFLALVRDSLE